MITACFCLARALVSIHGDLVSLCFVAFVDRNREIPNYRLVVRMGTKSIRFLTQLHTWIIIETGALIIVRDLRTEI
jgi:hypothetical protein